MKAMFCLRVFKSLLFLAFLLFLALSETLAQCPPVRQTVSNLSGATRCFDCTVTPETRSQLTGPFPVTVTFNGGSLSACGAGYYTVANTTCSPLPSSLTLTFSEPVGFISILVRNFANTPLLVTADNGFSETISGNAFVPGSGVTHVQISSTTPTWFFAIDTLDFAPDATLFGKAGTLMANPTSGVAGSQVTVIGEGWSQRATSRFELLLDGQIVDVQTAQFCTSFPFLTANIPCETSVGTHVLTCQTRDFFTQQIIASASIPFNVTGIAPGCQPCVPRAGGLSVSPGSGEPGTTVNVTGSNWTASPSGIYKLLFDGNLVAQQSSLSSCGDQPNLSFDIPCGTTLGNHTITIQLTDSSNQVLVSQQVSFSVTPPTFVGLAVTTCQNSPKVIFQYADGSSLPEPLRIGLTTKANKRTVSLRAVITPADSVEPKDIDIIINKGRVLKISNQKNDNNIITFDVDGEFSTLPELPIVMIQAKHKSLGILGSVIYRVVVPDKVDPAHDTEGQGVESGNLAQNETTSPAEPQANEKQAMLVTYYVRFLKIRLLDQYGESLEDIYNGSKVEESTDGKGFVSLNQPIQSGGVFLDPVGFTIPPFDKSLLVQKDSGEARKWPVQPKIMPPDGMGESPQAFALRIDDDNRMVIPIIKGIQNRVIKVKIVNGIVSITVSWP